VGASRDNNRVSFESTPDLSSGSYAKKQLFCADPIIAWSHRARFRFAQRLVRELRCGTLLDYGCGDGTFLALVRPQLERAVGADPDTSALASCRERFQGPGLSFVTLDALAQPEHAAAYDVVTCMEVLEHCPPDAAETVLSDLRRLVRPGGHLVISVPVEIGPSLVVKEALRTVAGWRRLGHYEFKERYTLRELATMVFAGEQTHIERPSWLSDTEGQRRTYGHKGFNWRALRMRLQRDHDVFTRFTPLPLFQGFLSSQAWLVCRP
jgi:SAM-dependent methyltransferase